jgi:serine O-acetyltransferase
MTLSLKYIIKKILIASLYRTYVVGDAIIQEDIDQTLKVRNSKVQEASMTDKFKHVMLYYPDFAFLFFWRIKRSNYRWKKWFTKEVPCKIFRSTKIAGGMMCYHPFATVINAQSIGRNFQFRNGLTIGNKHNDNTALPTIGSDVTVGAQVVIIGGITIGDHVVIGAGSVIVKDVPSNCVVAGNPAKILRRIDET